MTFEMEGTSAAEPPEFSQSSKRKPRECQYCKRLFRRYEHLERHLRIHTKEKPYKCACGSSFSRRDLLKRHEKNGHAPSSASTQQFSPEIGGSRDNAQSQSSLTHSDPRTLPWEPSEFQDTSIISSTQLNPLADYQLGNDLPNAQDLLFLESLEMFSNNIGLNNEWHLPSEPSITQITAGGHTVKTNARASPTTTYPSYEQSSGPEQTLSKLPTERESIAEFGVLTLPILTITKQHRENLLQALSKSDSTISDLSLPSCHALSRFANGFFDGFYPHLPMIHIPTFKIDEFEPDTLLAMCALGAEFRNENRKAVLLFRAAKAMLQQTIREREILEIERKLTTRNAGTTTDSSYEADESEFELLQQRTSIHDARCAFLLIAFATWQIEEDVAREAFNLQSFLARCIRECQMEEDEQHLYAHTTDWRSWIRQESDRRLKLFSFAFLNLHSIAFGTPPIILAEEVKLRLPCSCIEWIAPNQEKWNLARRSGHQEQMLFQDALHYLVKSCRESQVSNSQPVPSPLANYILLHAVIQQIVLAHHALSPFNDVSINLINGQKEVMRSVNHHLPMEILILIEVSLISKALHTWTSLWQRAPESSLDPRNPNGPVTFTSTALLGVAYVRLALNLGSYRILRYRDPRRVANQILQTPRLAPGPYLLPAILHATHALSIPVKLGVNFVAQSHAFVWSFQHSLCGFEFAVLLSKWLYCISDCQSSRPLDEHEKGLVAWISDIIEEGRTSGDDDLWSKPSGEPDFAYLGFAVVKLWARLIRGNGQWPLMRVIGDGLDIYADTCEQNSRHSGG